MEVVRPYLVHDPGAPGDTISCSLGPAVTLGGVVDWQCTA